MKRKNFCVFAGVLWLLTIQGALLAETPDSIAFTPPVAHHELRLTAGDMLMETLVWHNDTRKNYNGIGNENSVFYERRNTRWTPHMAVEYRYRVNNWFSAGLSVDFQYTAFDRVGYNNQNREVSRSVQYFYNLSLLPTVCFTYFRSPYVDLYSALSLGLDINGGTETDIHDRHTACAPAVDIRLFGVRAGYGRWFGSVEIGALNALKKTDIIYMLGSRLITVSFGVVL